MAIPTPVNGQITDALNAVHDAGGMDAVTPIVGLVEAIGRGLSGAELSAAFRKAELIQESVATDSLMVDVGDFFVSIQLL